MIVLHMEHGVARYEDWKAGFDSYADLRQKAGVRRYRIARAVDTPDFVTIDLEFDRVSDAEMLLGAVQQVWQRVSGTLIHDPHWRMTEVTEAQELRP